MNARVWLFLGLSAALTAAEGWSWPKVVMIGVEQVKPGKDSAHQMNEHAWALAYAQAKSPHHFLGMTPVAGGAEAWFVWPGQTFAEVEALRAYPDKQPELKKKVEALAAKDGEYITDFRSSAWVLRPDLSRSPADVAPRYYWVFDISARPGCEANISEMVKQMGATYDKAGIKARWAVYQAMAAPSVPRFLVVLPLHTLADLDGMMAEEMKYAQAAGEEGMKAISKLEAEGAAKEEGILLAVDPRMSYPGKDAVERDPEFWKDWDKAPAPKAK